MEIVTEKVERGVVEQRFDLHTGDDVVPGIRWSAEGATGPRPTVLIGHGGTQHKRAPYVLTLGRRLVRHLGYTAVALDAPEHGERVTDPDAAQRRRQALEARRTAGPGAGPPVFDPAEAKEWVERSTRAIGEWKTLVDELEADGGGGRYGYWGVSMGTLIGLPFVASDHRIVAAVLGLAGLGNRPGAEAFERSARALQVPVLLVLQWDDELVSRSGGLDLFDAIGSKEKTLHVNPGGHVDIPGFEMQSHETFFLRHLGPTRS
jgi:alpha-beta hydrolase superfamily lysophospholipase